ncbi:MAG: tRNA pseudouridine(38-40) synthase TruA [Bacteroidaceae bacterium]|nr:tRNA pseudouridine(38-40) synthase TruA [Bacteroidaceae bacterium]
MRFFITLSYDGTRYHGWQIQPNGDSIQQRLQEALSTLLRQPIEVVGAGRTDTGVHAKMMVAHFTIEDSKLGIESTGAPELCEEDSAFLQLQSSIKYRLNKLLPQDIAVQDVRQVSDDMHARFSATSRTYHYYIHTRKDPFLYAYSWLVPFKLDFEKMNEAAKVLLEYEDFTSFSKVNTDTKTNLCDLKEAYWQEVAPGQWRFTITANRFLRNMVRAIVGTLVEVGRGRIGIEDIRRIIEAKDRCSAGESVPGKALFLVDIKY